VSRKVGRAVRRNRIRRVLREFFRLHQEEIDRPLDIVVVPKRNLDPKTVDLALVEQEFPPVLSRVLREAPEAVHHERP
jgi:ribonuclease P protein component